MMLDSSLKQTFKKPLKTSLFFLLLTVAVTFLVLGISLFSSTQKNMEEINNVFRTIGTLEQKAIGYSEVSYYDAVSESYAYSMKPEYSAPVPLSAFDFEGVDYINPPENRPYYHAKSEEYPKGYGRVIDKNMINVIEFRVEELYPELVPVRAVVTHVFSGTYKEGAEVWICQHDTDNPVLLEVGKSYVCGIGYDMIDELYEDYHGIDRYTALNPVRPVLSLYSGQMGQNGEMLDQEKFQEYEWSHIFEVTESFYETDMGKRLLLYAQYTAEYFYYARITPTNSLELLLEFFGRDIYLQAGREITQEEFDEGTAVCMIDADHAEFNGLSVGDTVTFEFYDALYGEAPGEKYAQANVQIVTSTLIDADGELYEFFYTDTYEIVGIYERYKKSYHDLSDPYALGYGTVLIPSKSVKASDENNRNGNLILQPYNVSFEIPNGTSGEYLRKMNELGLDELVTATFYDRGYENIKVGLRNIQEISVILMLAGAFTTLTVLIFFSYLFIGKEKRRTGVERSLGVPKGQCAASLLAGVMILVVLGAAAGVAIGFTSGDFVMENAERLSRENEMSTAFSNWVNEQHEEEEYVFETVGGNDFVIPVTVFSAVLLVSLSIAGAFIWSNLTKEPLRLLSEREK